MSFSNRISQTLHEEHQATVALMERLEQLIARQRRSPPANERGVAQLLDELSRELGADVERHFAFEEAQLFTYLDAIGDKAIGAHLAGEHAAMRPLGTLLAALARNARDNGFDGPGWDEFRHIGGRAVRAHAGPRAKGGDGVAAAARGKHGRSDRSAALRILCRERVRTSP